MEMQASDGALSPRTTFVSKTWLPVGQSDTHLRLISTGVLPKGGSHAIGPILKERLARKRELRIGRSYRASGVEVCKWGLLVVNISRAGQVLRPDDNWSKWIWITKSGIHEVSI